MSCKHGVPSDEVCLFCLHDERRATRLNCRHVWETVGADGKMRCKNCDAFKAKTNERRYRPGRP